MWDAEGMLGAARTLWSHANIGGAMYTGAVFFAVRVALDAKVARTWLPPGVKLAEPAVATVFAAHFGDTSFGSVYDEAGIFFHVTRRFRSAVFCPWMVVTDDVALVVGRELLGYPKKLARISFEYGDANGGEVRADVERRGRMLLRLRGRVHERVLDAPPMLGQRALNVRGALGLGSQRLVTFTPRERIVEARRASAELELGTGVGTARIEHGRDPLDELGLGAVLGAHLYRVDVSAGLPPREVRGAGVRFMLRGLGARWL
ncbi:MAG: acetoacetate decarboxylase [Labilithrix sp.]|nr:acetoacetate decarboxylase [Labilithrix sp.]